MRPEDVPDEMLMLARRKAFQADPGRYPSPGNADADAGMAAALAAVLPAIQAQALRDAAGDMHRRWSQDDDGPAAWLEVRADRLTATTGVDG